MRTDRAAATWAIAAVALVGVSALAGIGTVWPSHVPEVLLLGALWGLMTLLGVRLGRGSMVHIDVSLALASLVLFRIEVVLVAFLAGGAAGILSNPRDVSAIGQRLLHIARKGVLVLALAPVAALVASRTQGGLSTVPAQAMLIGFGLLYALADLASSSVVESVRGKTNLVDEFIRLTRPIAVIYLGHISTGVVIVLLFDAMGHVGLVAMVTLVLMMQNSFNLLLKIRVAYQETIRALVLAAEMQVPGETGHARRVAELATAVGRRMGLRSHELERLGYAALLHDIGRIGAGPRDESPSGHAQLGADIVEQIPFVQSAAPVIRVHELDTGTLLALEDSRLATAALVVKASSRLDAAVRECPGAPPEKLLDSELFSDMRKTATGTRILAEFEAVADGWVAHKAYWNEGLPNAAR